ncbi:hypothetical protein TrVFT333_005096 [Trichoderma virens FT-333]|nr:hypothetical protein TrVFT333_005096 [Trichoderma virens FT-333]
MKRFLRSQLELSNSQFGDNATILQGDVFHHDTSDLPKPPRSVVRIIPYPRNRHLVHRPDLMNKLNALLPQRSHSYNSAALWGLGGTGEDLLAAVRDEIAAQLDWVLIVDNADDLRLFGVWEEASHEKLINYIPRAATGTVLWTTCDPSIAGTLVSPRHGIEVSFMKPDEAEELLAISRYAEMNEEEEKVETAALLEELHWLPLAITHVGAYMKRTSTSPKEYLSLLAQGKVRWDILNGFYEYRRLGILQRGSVKELPRCHFLVPIKRNANFIGRNSLLSKLLERIRPDAKKDDCQRTVIEGPEGVGKTQIALEAAYLVHEKNPFCSVFWIEGIDEDGVDIKQLVKTALSEESSGSWLLVIDDADTLEPLGLSTYLPFSRNGSILFALRNVEAAAKLYIPKENIFPIEGLDIEEALNLWQKVFKESRTSSARDTQRLSDFLRKSIWNYEKQRRWMEAEKLEVGVMEVLREFLGDKHSDTLSSMRNLASIYNRQGRYREAEALTAHVIGLLMEMLGDDHPDTLLSLHKLASIYEKQGRYIEAQALEVQVLEVLRKTLGDKHRSTLSSMSNLAWIYKQQGRYIDAEELVALVIELRKEVLGGEHPAVMASMSSLASIYEKQNRYIEAEALELQVLGVLRKTLGHKNHNVLSSMHNLALVYEKQGRLREAEALEVQVLEFRKEILGGDNPDTLSSIHSLALIYEKQGRLREAEVLEEQAMRLYTGILGVDHLITLSSIHDLASIYEKQGRHIEAEALKEQVIKGYQMVIEADDDRMLEGMHRLAPIYMQMGRQEDAEKLKTRILEIREARLDHFLQHSPLKGKPRDAEGDSGYGSASRRATTTILSVSDLQNDINVIASVERVEIKDDIRMQSDDDIRSVVSVDDDIRSQTSDATSNEGMTGKALIRTFLAEQPQFKALCEKALDKMNRQRFVKNMSRLLKSFHICLAKEAESEAEKAVAELLRSKKGRQRISKQLVSHISMEKEEALDFGQGDLEIPLSRRVNVENWLSQIAKKVPRLRTQSQLNKTKTATL